VFLGLFLISGEMICGDLGAVLLIETINLKRNLED
jgi:hypothetical protein